MIDNAPPSPSGHSDFHAWTKWVQRSLLALRTQEQAGASTNRTSRGTYVLRPARRPKHLVAGQVIALHRFAGHPPFSANQLGVFTGPSARVSEIAAWLTSEAGTEPTMDFDNIPNAPTTINSPCRYLTTRFWTDGYEHIRTCAKHDGGGIGSSFIANGGDLVYESLTAYRNDTEPPRKETYVFKVNNDGTFPDGVHHTAYADTYFYGPVQCRSFELYGSLSWPGDGWVGGGATDWAEITATGAHYHSDNVATRTTPPYDEQHDIGDFYMELGGGWSLQDLQKELDAMLAQVDLTNPSKRYLIDGERRALNKAGEQITVTREGPAEGVKVHYVLTSTLNPWSWDGTGSCVVAENVNDLVNHWVDSGVFDENGIPEPLPPGVLKGDIIGGGSADYCKMVKSVLRLPIGSLTKTVDTYAAPSPDGATYPADQNDHTGGQLQLPQAVTTISGAGKLVLFPRGDWITVTKLAATGGG